MHYTKAFRRWYEEEVVLTLGRRSYTRRECVEELQIVSYRAMTNLTRALKANKVRTHAELRDLDWWKIREVPQVGERAVFVASHIVKAQFGDKVLDEWIARIKPRKKSEK